MFHLFTTHLHADISCSITSASLSSPLVESRHAFNVDPCATARPACLGRYFAAEQRPSTTSIGPDVLVSETDFQVQTTAECSDPIKHGKVVRDAEAPHLNVVTARGEHSHTIPDSPLHRAFVVAVVARLESTSRDARRDIYAFLWCCRFLNQCLTGTRREQKDGTSHAPLLHATQAAETD